MVYVCVAAEGDIPEGGMIPVEAEGKKLLLAKVEGTIYATQRKCPHLGFNLCRGSIEGRSVMCVLHKARFDLATGEIERDPRLLFITMKARKPLQTHPVRVVDGEVMVGV